MRLRSFVGIFWLVAVGMAGANAQTSKIVFLKCGAPVDGQSETARKNVVIAVQGDRIHEVGGAAAGTDVIDLSHETCLPGLIDTHTHVLLQGDITAADYDEQLLKQSTEYRAILATLNVRRALEYGFTSIRDVETEGAGYAPLFWVPPGKSTEIKVNWA